MLIRSQDKRMIVNFENICTVSAFPEKDSEDIYVEDGTGSLMVGRYSTKAKAIKVLDMIQEAYSEYQIMLNFSVSYLHEFKEKTDGFAIFQMPEDSEVEE